MAKCVVYMRYSTDHQKATSLDRQLAEINKFCQKNDIQICNIFADPGYSGTNVKRPAFQRMVQEASQKPEWNLILVYDLSRFSRNVRDASHYKDYFRDHGIDVLSVTEPFTHSEANRLLENIVDAINAEYSRKIGETTLGTLKTLASKGIHCGGVAPLGYDVGNDRKLVINKHEAEIVKAIFHMYNNGVSLEKMAKTLNQKGMRTKNGAKFTSTSFYDILRREKYAGTFKWNTRVCKYPNGSWNSHAKKDEDNYIIVEDGCPAIIDRELFDSVQAKLDSHTQTKAKRHYMLSGLGILKCAHCGRAMVGLTNNSRGYEYVWYGCPNHKKDDCPTKNIKADDLDQFVAKALMRKYFSSQDNDELNQLVYASNKPSLEIKLLQQKLKGVNKRIKNITRTLGKEKNSSLIEELTNLEEEKSATEKLLSELQLKLPEISNDNRKKVFRKTGWKLIASDDVDVRCFIKSAVKEILIGNDEIVLRLNDELSQDAA